MVGMAAYCTQHLGESGGEWGIVGDSGEEREREWGIVGRKGESGLRSLEQLTVLEHITNI